MDSRELPPPQPQQPPALPHLHPQQQHHHQQQQQHQQHHHHHHHHHQQNMISPYSSSMINHNNPNATIPNPNSASSGFPFNSVAPHAPQPQLQRPPSKTPAEGGVEGGVFDGSSPPSSGMGFSIEPGKKKRGRPRKYTPEGNIALGLSTTGVSPSGGAASVGYSDSGGGGGAPGGSSEPAPKRNRGRPPGSGKRQLEALGGIGGVGFTPHVITVKAGEDVASQIMAFSQQGPRTVCILSANGAIRNVTLNQPAMSGATVTYEGRFEIISLSGSYLFSENNGGRNRSGGLSVSLAGADGRVLGGGVAGVLVAASTVQVIVGSFVAGGKKSSSGLSKSRLTSATGPPMLNFGAPLTASSPPSQGASSESSDDNGGSPLNRGPGLYSNSGQQMQSMHMYHHLWTGQNPQ